MLRTTLLAATVSVALLPANLFAGGPPWLCLPIDGVTADNATACAELLTSKLKGKTWSPNGAQRGVRIQQRSNQWYLTFYLAEEVGLKEIESALANTKYSIPRDRIRFFGHVVIEMDPGGTPPKQIAAALDSLEQVSVVESNKKGSHLAVTLEMPYPVDNHRPEDNPVAWEKFQKNGFIATQSNKSDSPTTARALPSYKAIQEVIAKQQSTLKDMRWSTDYACRPMGGVAVSSELEKRSIVRPAAR